MKEAKQVLDSINHLDNNQPPSIIHPPKEQSSQLFAKTNKEGFRAYV
jgi:hypothetical protein